MKKLLFFRFSIPCRISIPFGSDIYIYVGKKPLEKNIFSTYISCGFEIVLDFCIYHYCQTTITVLIKEIDKRNLYIYIYLYISLPENYRVSEITI